LFYLAKRLKQLSLNEKCLIATLLAYLVAGIAETSLLRLWSVVLIFLLSGLLTNCRRLETSTSEYA